MGFFDFWSHVKHSRKQHRCEVCGGTIAVGDPSHTTTSRTHPGAFVFTKKYCEACYITKKESAKK